MTPALHPDDLPRIAKQRDRHPQGGAAWQAWQRIYQLAERALQEADRG